MIFTEKLSPTETRVLSMLSHGEAYAQIASSMVLTVENVHTIAYRIRQKTGIADTTDRLQCKEWVRQHREWKQKPAPEGPRKPTSRQECAMRLHALNYSYKEIAHRMELSSTQSAQNCVSNGCKRVGITFAGAKRKQFIREYLAKMDAQDWQPTPSPMDDPAFS